MKSALEAKTNKKMLKTKNIALKPQIRISHSMTLSDRDPVIRRRRLFELAVVWATGVYIN